MDSVSAAERMARTAQKMTATFSHMLRSLRWYVNDRSVICGAR